MISSRELIKQFQQNYEHYFTRERGFRYWLVVVNNDYDGVYTVFLYAQVLKKRLIRSSELVEFPNTKRILYEEVLAAIKAETNLSIVYRDTNHLVHPGNDVQVDQQHGHAF